MNKRDFGDRGEDVAVDYLKANGFKIIQRNFRCKLGEIDVIAKKKGELYFVEVKARSDDYFGDPLESVTLRKQAQIVKIAKYFLQKYKKEVGCHFSAMGIVFDGGMPNITFIIDAFDVST